MPAIRLPTLDNAPARISGEAEQLVAFLGLPNDPTMVTRIGREDEVRREGNLLVLRGERYRNREGWVQGGRYLRLDEQGRPVAVLNITQIAQGRRVSTLASNVYVAPEYRRQGLASALMRAALADHPRLCTDTSMSEAGAALTGHAAATPVAPKRRPTP